MKQSYIVLSFIFLLILLPTCFIFAHNEVLDLKEREFGYKSNRYNGHLDIKPELYFTADEVTVAQVVFPDARNLSFSMTRAGVPTSITFLEYVVNGLVGEETCLTATIFDEYRVPLFGVELFYEVNGVFQGSAISDENGRIKICQTPVVTGDLEVAVYFEGGEPKEATIVAGMVSEDLKIDSFWLVDAESNVFMKELKDGVKIPYSTIQDKKLSLVVISDPEIVGSVKMDMEFLTQCAICEVDSHSITENLVPYSLFGDAKGNYVGKEFLPGSYSLTATPYEAKYRTGNQGALSIINFEVVFDKFIDGFTLVNASDDKDIQVIMDGDVIDLSSFKNGKFNIRANVPFSQTQGGVGMELSGPINFSQFEKVEPIALFTDVGGDYTGRGLPEGKYTLSATAYPFSSSINRGIGGETLTIDFEVVQNSKIDKFTLINADTDQDIMTIVEGSYIDLRLYKDVKLNIRAEGKGDNIAAMTFMLSGTKNYNWTERKAPFAIFGDSPGNDYNGKYFQAGNYKLTVRPYSSDNMIGEGLTVNFSAGYDANKSLRIGNEFLNQLEAKEAEVGAVDPLQEEDLIVYPQPSQNVVNIRYPSSLNENAMVMIYKGNGQLIHGGQMGNTSNFNFESYGSGLYLIHVNNGDNLISKKVFIY